jgi:hypothetical protein
MTMSSAYTVNVAVMVAKNLNANALHDDDHLALPMLVKLDKEVKHTHALSSRKIGGHVVGLMEATYQGDDHVVGVHSQRCELVAKHLDANALHDDAHLALPMLVKLDKEVKRTH